MPRHRFLTMSVMPPQAAAQAAAGPLFRGCLIRFFFALIWRCVTGEAAIRVPQAVNSRADQLTPRP